MSTETDNSKSAAASSLPEGIKTNEPYLVVWPEFIRTKNRLQLRIQFNGKIVTVGEGFRYKFLRFPKTQEEEKKHPAFNDAYVKAASSGELFWELRNAATEESAIFIQKKKSDEKSSEESCARAPRIEQEKKQSAKSPDKHKWARSKRTSKAPEPQKLQYPSLP